jgi:hypothetical protein
LGAAFDFKTFRLPFGNGDFSEDTFELSGAIATYAAACYDKKILISGLT